MFLSPRFAASLGRGLFAVCTLICASAGVALAQGPTIDVWYGLNQNFGALGHAQRFVNILGRVTDADGVASLTGQLNGGTIKPLSIGPDDRRLMMPGDFNHDILRTTLVNGANTLALVATDTLNNITTVNVTIQYTANSAWPRTWTTDWSTMSSVTEGSQIGDGLWHIDAEGARLTEGGYDRTLMIGDEITWNNYEVLVPVTIHSYDPAGFLGTALAPAFGITNRWVGHFERVYFEQPYTGWTRQGGGLWYEYGSLGGARLSLQGFEGMQIDRYQEVPIGQKHWWKIRSETLPNGDTFYGLKYWADGAAEPINWYLSGTESPDDLQRGSLIFIAHYVDVSIGNVQVTALADEVATPTLFDVQWQQGSHCVRATWNSDEPCTSELAYGLTTAYELGVIRGTDPLVRHSSVIGALTPGQSYYYELRGKDARGQSATPLTGCISTAMTAPPHPSGLVSDDFSGSQLNESTWIFIDPRNDARATVNGHQLEIEVPAGQSHGGWYDTNGNQMPRVVQNVANVDFEIEAKFDSPIDMLSKAQGIVVEQDANNFLRFDFLYSSLGTRIWVGGALNGYRPFLFEQRIQALTSPAWMRVWREGTVWTVWYSFDGLFWTNAVVFDHTLNVTRVGVAAGNAQGTAHTAEIDYFFVTLNPLMNEDGNPSRLVTQTFGGGSIERSPDLNHYAENTQVVLTATAEPGWFFDGWAGDFSGLANPLDVVTNSEQRLAVAVFSPGPDHTPPIISQIQVIRAAHSAEIKWRTNEPSSAYVLFGPTTSYTASVEDTRLLKQHSAVLENLAAGRIYNFRIYAEDASGNQASTANWTLRTTAAGNPLLIDSDDFSSVGLNENEWSFVDPNEDSDFAFNAQRLSITVPAGSTHDAWSQTNGNKLARIMQAAPDTDFSVDVRFESDVTLNSQAQGILFEQDLDNYLKVEIVRSNGAKRLFAGTVRNRTTTTIHGFFPVTLPTPVHLRVARQGSVWTISTSPLGSTWTQQMSFSQTLQVSAAGVYAGNTLGTAHTMLCDFVFDTAHPIVPEDGNPSQLVVNTTGHGKVDRLPKAQYYAANEIVELTAVAQPAWVFSHWAGSASGTANPIMVTAGLQPTVTAVFVRDATPPAILNVQALPASRRATVVWTTDEPAAGQVHWGRSVNYGTSVGSTVLKTSHVETIYGLSPGESIHYQVHATDAAGNGTQTADAVFRTRAGFVSDDFAGAILDRTRWRLEDPTNAADATLASRRLELTVPRTNVEPAFEPTRLVQELENGDFSIQTKIESQFTAQRGQTIGLIAVSNATNEVRFGATWVNDHLRFTSERREGGIRTRAEFPLAPMALQLPLYLRLVRVNDQWNLDHSFDGQVWISTFAFQQSISDLVAGVFVENRSSASLTAQFDYVFETTNPIVPEDGAPSALVVNTSGPGYVTRVPDLPRYAAGQTVLLTAIPFAGRTFAGWEGAFVGTSNAISIVVGTSSVLTARFDRE